MTVDVAASESASAAETDSSVTVHASSPSLMLLSPRCAGCSSVIRLMLQYLQENNLQSSLRALQEETQVGLNAVDDVARFSHYIATGSQSAQI